MTPIPLHVLTGFLGSGKTTLLAALLRAPGVGRLAVLVNEAGDLPLDQHLLARVDDEVLALPSGCLCCVRRGELAAALARLAEQAPERIVVETTGLADPAPVLAALADDPRLAGRVRVAGVTAVLDAQRADELLDAEPEARRQVAVADKLVLTRPDLAGRRLPALRARLACEAPGRELRTALHGAVDPAWFFDARPLAALRDAADARRWLHRDPGGAPAGPAHTATRSVHLPAPADPAVLQLWLRLVTQLDGPRLLRVKALVEDAAGAVHVLQAAGRSVSPPLRLARRPAGVRGVQAVLIARGLDERALARLVQSLEQAARGAQTSAPT